MEREITIWVVAILIVAAPMSIGFATFMRRDQQANEQFTTREDLLAHLNNQSLAAFWPCWLLITLIGGAFVAAVALVAHWLKVVVERVV